MPDERHPPTSSLLGADFLAGVATSGYQVEGGFNGDGEPQNNWSSWENTGRAERSGLACDFWRHPEDALDRAQSLGANAFRLSVEWARLEPRSGEFDQGALERYAEILSLCADRGLAPMVTLSHFTHPWFLGEEFWLRPGSPDVFLRHVERILPALIPYCRHWVTINEPNIVTLMGWIQGACPPGRKMATADSFCVLDNLLSAHVLVADAISTVQPEAAVTMNTSSSSIYEHDRMLDDLLSLRAAGVEAGAVDRYIDERRILHDAAFPPQHAGEAAVRRFFAAICPYGEQKEPGRGPLWAYVRRATRRPAPRRVVDAVHSSTRPHALDAVSFDWYDPVASHAMRRPPRRLPSGDLDWSFGRAIWDVESHPAALAAWVTTEAALRPGLPLWVVENGMASRVRHGVALPRDDRLDRPRYVREHLGAVAAAVAEGVPVQAYLHWSLVDNYEWGTYEPRFGLFGMDRSDPAAPRWLDTDAQGDDAAGEFARLLTGLRAGDRSVLEAPG